MTILILFASVATFGMTGIIKVQSFPNSVACEVALTAFEKAMPGARFECVENNLGNPT